MRKSLYQILSFVVLLTVCEAAPAERAELVPRVARELSSSIALNHDGSLLATSDGIRIHLWETTRGLPIRSLVCRRPTIENLPEGAQVLHQNDVPSFSPDGRYLAATVANYPKLAGDGYFVVPCVWDLASGRSLTEGTWRYVTRPDGEPALEDFPFGLSEPWKWLKNRDELALYKAISDVTSADERFVASLVPAEGDSGRISIQLQRLADGEPLRRLELEKTQRVHTLVFSPDGRWLVSQDYDYERWRLIVWEVETGARYKTLDGDRAFSGITFSPDSHWLSLARDQERLVVYDLASWDPIWSHPEIDGFHLEVVMFSSNGRIFALTHQYEPIIEIWQTDDWTRRVRFDCFGLVPVTSLALSSGGAELAVGSQQSENEQFLPSLYGFDGLIELWSLQSGGAPRRLEEDMSIRGLAFSPDGKRIATASQDETQQGRSSGTLEGQVRLWNIETAEPRALLDPDEEVWFTPRPEEPDDHQIIIPTSSATKVAFVPGSGDLVAGVYRLSATWEGMTWVEFGSNVRLTFWDPQSGKELKVLDTERSELHALAVSPDGKTIATGHEGGYMLLWNVSTGEKLQEMRSDRARRMDAAAFHPDGSTLVSGDSQGLLMVWDPRTGEQLRRLSDHPEGVTDIAFDGPGTFLATASCNDYEPSTGRFRLWNTSSDEVLFERTGCPNVLLFTPDDRFLIVGDRDGVTRLYEVDTGQLVVSLALHPNIDAWLVWTPDGLYDGNDEGMERIVVWRRGTEVRRLAEFPSRYHIPDLLPKVLSGAFDRPERPMTELPTPK